MSVRKQYIIGIECSDYFTIAEIRTILESRGIIVNHIEAADVKDIIETIKTMGEMADRIMEALKKRNGET